MIGRNAHDLPLVQPLTPREQEILNCLGDNMSNRQIAEHLTVSLNTVKWYVRQIYNKLGVDNRGEAVTRARRLGLLPAEVQEVAIKHNLPAAATPFVGREQELATLDKLIANTDIRIITIVGPGGIGKTRLTLEAAGRELRAQSQFPDGIFFISLAPVESAGEITAALATVLGFHFQGSGNETGEILNYLGQKQTLLVMDNFEHILEGQKLLAEIVSRTAKVKLLVTSRERLQMRGEQLFPLQGLELALIGDPVEEAPAAQLFLNIARRTMPDFQLFEGDAEQLLRICRLVEGMPLGLELAASWVGLLPLSAIAKEIERSLDLLATEHSDVPQRHQSMQATLDVSWNKLSEEQQLVFQKLTIFRGGFTRNAALEVTAATLPLLVTLVNKSWLSYGRQKDRYFIHELLRQYGAGKLSINSAHEQEVRERHSIYFCGYLKEREADWFGARQREAASEVRDEIENIQSAWRWAAIQGDGVLLAQGLNSLCRFYFRESRKTDGQIACRSAGDGLSKSLAEQPTDDPQGLALWSQILAWEADFVSEMAQKENLLAQSQGILDRVALTGRDTRREQAFVFLVRAYAAGNRDYEEAIRVGNLGLELFRDLDDRWGEAEVLGLLGSNYASHGAFDQANDLLGESLEIRRQLDDTQGIIETMINLGLAAQYEGRFVEAEALHREGFRLSKQLKHPLHQNWCLTVLSFTLSWAGKFLAAREAAERALELDRDWGQMSNLWSLIALTMATFHLGSYTETVADAAEGLETAKKRGLLTEAAFALAFLGSIAFAEGDIAGAKRHCLESASILSELKHVNRALPQAILSHVNRAQGDGELARDFLIGALRSGLEVRSISPIMYCLPVAALLAADSGRPQRAIELYGLAQRFTHITNSRWFEDVACKELEEVRASLPPEVAIAATTRGRQLDLWSTADDLLNKLKTLGHADG